jgi:predicted  nucleic acid-binding Zn-ribbon protein
MSDFKEMGNAQIMTEIVALQSEHEAIKQRILKEMDALDKVEKEFNEANTILANRIKGQTNA